MEDEQFKQVGKSEWFNWYDVEKSKFKSFRCITNIPSMLYLRIGRNNNITCYSCFFRK